MLPTGIPTGTTPAPTIPVTGDQAAREAAVRPIVQREAAARGLPVDLVMAVIAQESAFDPKAVSPTGAQGLMQLMPGTVADINLRAPNGVHVGDPFDPAQNVLGGAWYLAWVHQQVPLASVAAGDDWKFALGGYNGGIGRVQGAITQTRQGAGRVTWDDVAPLLPAETQRYVPQVLARRSRYL
ncbi:MAG: lytic transglycosylase [Cyanobacteria bacterium RYN_339]|nr:lytic transglycosylase [Cyanobacteria bacterium RYN_339]